MATICLHDVKFFAHHGCFEEERLIGTHFSVDVTLEIDDCPAMYSDNLDDAIDYAAVYQVIAKEMEKPSRLLEHVAGRILQSLMSAYAPVACKVTVSKWAPPLGGEVARASVTLTEKDIRHG
ncbi:MAG: dihydroneopterin aldolase [Bacteroidales bacterium]|jgi:dihydroneopterin aldolase|nr:dihydroneopterin aldolase [Bacteroidales bacterium]